MRKSGAAGVVFALVVALAACSPPPPRVAASTPAKPARQSGDLFADAARTLGLAATPPAPLPAVHAPRTAKVAAEKPEPHCIQWGADVYGDPTCIEYSDD